MLKVGKLVFILPNHFGVGGYALVLLVLERNTLDETYYLLQTLTNRLTIEWYNSYNIYKQRIVTLKDKKEIEEFLLNYKYQS